MLKFARWLCLLSIFDSREAVMLDFGPNTFSVLAQ